MTVGQSFSSALETEVYSAVPVSVPTCTGELPACTITSALVGVHCATLVQLGALNAIWVQALQLRVYVEASVFTVAFAVAGTVV